MKFAALAVTGLAALASVASATDNQPALRALAAQESAALGANTLAADPAEQRPSPVEAAAANKEAATNVDADGNKHKEWWGGYGWGRPWGGYGWGRPWGGYGWGRPWGGYGWGW